MHALCLLNMRCFHLTQANFWLELAIIMNMDGEFAIVPILIPASGIRSGEKLLVVYN